MTKATQNKAKDVETKKIDTTQLWAQIGRLTAQREQELLKAQPFLNAAEKARQDMVAIYQQIANLEKNNG